MVAHSAASRLGVAMAFAWLGLGSLALAAEERTEVCRDPALTRQEKALCEEQIAAAQTAAEQKKIQAKFRDRIAKRKPK
jgi:hypothetical protein